jgi:hypothetical protein
MRTSLGVSRKQLSKMRQAMASMELEELLEIQGHLEGSGAAAESSGDAS